jgi:hypothetical protein
MKKILKDLFLANKKAYREFKDQDVINLNSGISKRERERLLNYPPFTTGTTKFYDHEFVFSHGPSFIHSVDELLVEEIYKFTTTSQQPYIIDCGANIGLSLYYFKKWYPSSKILAFEPDEQIFNILEKNISYFPNNNDIII